MCASIFGAISCFHIFGNHFDLLIGFEIDEDRRALHDRPDLLRIENMKQNHFVAVKAQRRDGVDNGFRILVEIGDHDRDAAPMEEILKMLERLGKIGARARLGLFEAGKQARELSGPRGRANVFADLVVENDQPGRVALIAGWRDRTATAAMKRA